MTFPEAVAFGQVGGLYACLTATGSYRIRTCFPGQYKVYHKLSAGIGQDLDCFLDILFFKFLKKLLLFSVFLLYLSLD